MKAFRGWRRREPVSTLPSLAAYAQWSADYPPVAHNPLMRAEQSAMWALMPHLAGRVVLDLAGGSGRYARLAHAAGAANVYVLDNSLPMLQIGQRCGVNAQFVEGDSAAIPLQAACVDVVICALALGHLPHIEPTFDEIRRILRTGGSLLISDFHPQLFAAGAQRTFTDAGGKLHAVEHYAHPTSHYLRCAATRDLHCTAQQAPHIAGIAQGRPLVAVYRFDCVR